MSFSLFEHGVTAAQISRINKEEAARAKAELLLREWKKSEIILNILRAIQPNTQKPSRETMHTWFHQLPGRAVDLRKYEPLRQHITDDERASSCNEWFSKRFPEAAELYGPAFLERATRDQDGLDRLTPFFINDDFFAAILGGEKALGHTMVFCPEEKRWYFYDHLVQAFCPTSEEKLKLLLSNYLMRCSQETEYRADIIPLVSVFRNDKQLQAIVTKGRAMYETASTFFRGKDGHRRYVDGKYVEPTDEPSCRLFVKTALVSHPGARMTLSDAYSRYYRFCSDTQIPPLARSDFKALMREAIRESFGIGFRHDVPDAEGKQQHGWFGIDCHVSDRSEVSRN